jgi:formylglycine-generating enzyme required for sulfatase activity
MNFRGVYLILVILLFSPVTATAQIISIHSAEGTQSFDLAEVDSIGFVDLQPGEEREFQLTGDVSIIMVWIPSGSFMMGRQENEQGSEDREDPRHEVNLNYGFWMGKYEVTQAQWEAVTGSNPSEYDGENHPVEHVSWDDIQNDFLPQIAGGFRLPSGAEWEYACRAGTETRFYWGDDPNHEEIREYAVYAANMRNGTEEVGTKVPNSWGLYDMSGNVYEWCEDCLHYGYLNAPNDGSAWIEPPTDYRVYRGGGYNFEPPWCRSAGLRSGDEPSERLNWVGFRLVRSL